jgi:ABC-type antimicrobial peptide transport system permease subunit
MFIVLLIVVLDGIRKQQRNMRESAIRLSLGERRTTAVAGYAVGNVIFYAPLAVLAFFVGHAFAQLQFATWIPFDVFSTAAVVVAALMGVSLLVVCVIYAIRLKKLDIYGFLTSERG